MGYSWKLSRAKKQEFAKKIEIHKKLIEGKKLDGHGYEIRREK